ncbi:hypothetical protein EW146_g2818 [Bondarzewia mesenterica]|uniref:SAP domain-containing protein n=1 Tax=Bondarzewia mesenterica TaxID=1095465 RepID=A0A4S4LZI3_9AGAM|nr:hypothetical protein EW146_g2818 [Bondarzewia mesenterica]
MSTFRDLKPLYTSCEYCNLSAQITVSAADSSRNNMLVGSPSIWLRPKSPLDVRRAKRLNCSSLFAVKSLELSSFSSLSQTIQAIKAHNPPSTLLTASPVDLVHDAYRRMSHEQLHLFCTVRSLSTAGTDVELASRLAHHDLHLYAFPSTLRETNERAIPTGLHSLTVAEKKPGDGSRLCLGRDAIQSVQTTRIRHVRVPPLPVELMAEIMDHVGDWELSKAVGLPTSLPQPLSWTRASPTDHALLTGYLPLLVSCEPSIHPPTSVGATLIVRFAYTHILSYLFLHHRPLFRKLYRHDLIFIAASQHGRVQVLDWWSAMRKEYPSEFPVPSTKAIVDAIDSASRSGQVASLNWWLSSDLSFEYTEAALEHASAKNQIAVLEWWRLQRGRLPLKVGRVMDTASAAGHVDALAWWAASGLDYTYDKQALYHASCHGRVEVLDWWLNSGLQLFFDQDALVGATRHDRPEVLEWWDKSGLPIQYRMCDIEEALEDAIGGGERAREWWKKKGVDFNANDKEWMKLQNLN